MACLHKFAAGLNLERLDFEPATLIVGTFNPGWDKLHNEASWFYGRTRNNYFWEVLPRLYGLASLRRAPAGEWKAFCRQYRLALTDLIYSIEDACDNNPDHLAYIGSYRDDLIARHFKAVTPVDIPGILCRHPAISNVYITRSIGGRFWRRLWRPAGDFCQDHKIQTQTLLTPSGGARFKMPKNSKIGLGDFIFEKWQEKWHTV